MEKGKVLALISAVLYLVASLCAIIGGAHIAVFMFLVCSCLVGTRIIREMKS